MVYVLIKLGLMLAIVFAMLAFVAGDEIIAICFILWAILLQLMAIEEKMK